MEELPLRHQHSLQTEEGAGALQEEMGHRELIQGAQRLPSEDDLEELHREATLLRHRDVHLQRLVPLQRAHSAGAMTKRT